MFNSNETIKLIGSISGILIPLIFLLCLFLVKKNTHYKYENYTKFAFSRLASHKSTFKYALFLFLTVSFLKLFFVISLNQAINLSTLLITLNIISIVALPLIILTSKKYNSILHLSLAFIYYLCELIFFIFINIIMITRENIIGLIGTIILMVGLICSLIIMAKKPYKISGKEEIILFIPIALSYILYSFYLIN